MLQRCRAHEVHGQRGLTHAGAGGDDNHLTGAQAIGQIIQVDESGGHARFHAVLLQGGEFVDSGIDKIAQCPVVLGGLLLRHREDFLLGAVQNRFDLHLLGTLEAELHNSGSGVDQLAQHRLFRHDLRVVASVSGGRHRGQQGVQVRRAADPLEVVVAIEPSCHNHRINIGARGIEVNHGLIDERVRRIVEVLRLQLFNDLHHRVRAQEHSAKNALLCFPVRGWLAEFAVTLRLLLAVRAAGFLLYRFRRRWNLIVVKTGISHCPSIPPFIDPTLTAPENLSFYPRRTARL